MRGEELARAIDIRAKDLPRPLRESGQQAEGMGRKQVRGRGARVVDDVPDPADPFGDLR